MRYHFTGCAQTEPQCLAPSQTTTAGMSGLRDDIYRLAIPDQVQAVPTNPSATESMAGPGSCLEDVQ